MRGLTAVVGVGVALMVAGCGGSAPPSRHAIHVDGKTTQGDYVLETDASGAQFLVPAPVLSGQGSHAFDVEAPASARVGQQTTAGRTGNPSDKFIVASTDAVVPHSAHVELLATGAPNVHFALFWEETCGYRRDGHGDSGGTGAQGSATLRSPAVTLVRLPRISGGVPSCYLAATASARTFTRALHLAIIDY
jgi:hypothetical protein